jgi:hypothetical protein
MPLMATAVLFNGPNQTGTSLFTGLATSGRYAQITNADLTSHGMINSVASGSLNCSAADLNLVCFANADYTGGFFQISLSRNDGSATFWHTGSAQSALLIASNNAGVRENRVSFVDTFRSKWDSFLDGQLQGTKVTRDVEPVLTWQMFPANNKWLDPSQVYLRIHQPLHVHLPWYWPDYQASMDYNVVLFIDGDRHLRAWVADWECWVEGGAKNGQIHEQLNPQVAAGMSSLQDQMNQNLALTDLLGPVKAMFYLPGRQTSPIGTATLGGNTNDDVTIVIQT